MILIADSGATKTDWRLVDDEKQIHQYNTIGFNPFFIDTAGIIAELKTKLQPELGEMLKNKAPEIYFYGAGCSSAVNCKIVEDALADIFPGAIINVEHDLLGAARAACLNEEGIAVILGTGSNSCYYDGMVIKENIPALGFILGDEGSGAHIGKTFIQAYLNKELPQNIVDNFERRFQLSSNDILNAVYKEPMPNRFLASFSKFVFQNIKEPVMLQLVEGCFNAFFDKHICKYAQHKEVNMNCVGSVAFYYSKVLQAVAEKRGVRIGRILETPIAGLTLFHTEH